MMPSAHRRVILPTVLAANGSGKESEAAGPTLISWSPALFRIDALQLRKGAAWAVVDDSAPPRRTVRQGSRVQILVGVRLDSGQFGVPPTNESLCLLAADAPS